MAASIIVNRFCIKGIAEVVSVYFGFFGVVFDINNGFLLFDASRPRDQVAALRQGEAVDQAILLALCTSTHKELRPGMDTS
jgi:hypothetical protein